MCETEGGCVCALIATWFPERGNVARDVQDSEVCVAFNTDVTQIITNFILWLTSTDALAREEVAMYEWWAVSFRASDNPTAVSSTDHPVLYLTRFLHAPFVESSRVGRSLSIVHVLYDMCICLAGNAVHQNLILVHENCYWKSNNDSVWCSQGINQALIRTVQIYFPVYSFNG